MDTYMYVLYLAGKKQHFIRNSTPYIKIIHIFTRITTKQLIDYKGKWNFFRKGNNNGFCYMQTIHTQMSMFHWYVPLASTSLCPNFREAAPIFVLA